MVRRLLFHHVSQSNFNYRGKEVFRIEALSDAVFAFSVSLLVASLEVPKSFEELKEIAAGALPFFATVAMIFLFWYRQYIFFRRYGLNDFTTIVLNLVYLSVILYYVYPLKFLFSILLSYWSGIDFSPGNNEKNLAFLSGEEFPQLIILFSIGYFLIWTVIFLSYYHVLRRKGHFNFTAYELNFTKKEESGALYNAIIGMLAFAFAWFHQQLFASLCYILIPVIMIINERRFRRGLSINKTAGEKQSRRITSKTIQ
jgi:uncharacterized membrane protein